MQVADTGQQKIDAAKIEANVYRSKISDYQSLIVFSYLPLRKVLTDIRALSKKTAKVLVDSEIANENKVYEWKIRPADECLLHEDKLHLMMVRMNPIFQLISEIKFNFP